MITAIVFLLIMCIVDIIIQSMRLQQNNDDGRAWLSIIAQLIEICILVWMLIYYLLNIHPILTGR